MCINKNWIYKILLKVASTSSQGRPHVNLLSWVSNRDVPFVPYCRLLTFSHKCSIFQVRAWVLRFTKSTEGLTVIRLWPNCISWVVYVRYSADVIEVIDITDYCIIEISVSANRSGIKKEKKYYHCLFFFELPCRVLFVILCVIVSSCKYIFISYDNIINPIYDHNWIF